MRRGQGAKYDCAAFVLALEGWHRSNKHFLKMLRRGVEAGVRYGTFKRDV